MDRKRKNIRKLYEAAEEGNLAFLTSLLQEDEHILEKSSFRETPLHVAAMLGQLDFAKAIISRKPDLVAALDFAKRSPLYLVAANGHLEMAKELILAEPEMCRVRDRDSLNPVHVAVVRGQIPVLKELVRVRPEAAVARGEHGETILHLCVKFDRIEAMEFLVAMSISDPWFVNLKDDDGFTVLHRAVARRHTEMINILISKIAIDVNERNAEGQTALDLVLTDKDTRNFEQTESLIDLLIRVGAVKGENQNSITEPSAKPISPHPSGTKTENPIWLEQHQNAVMAVAAILATAAFQAGITNSPRAFSSIFTYILFAVFNATAFLTSLCTIITMMLGCLRPNKQFFSVKVLPWIMWIAVSSMTLAYLIISESENKLK